MEKYEDKKISFSYPGEFILTRIKPKWGQYTLRKESVLITIYLLAKDSVDSAKTTIRSKLPDRIEDFAEIERFDSVSFGDNEGIGHIVTLYDSSHNFDEKLYRYLFPIPSGGIYIEISSSQDFEIDVYRELLKSIKVKEIA